MKSIGGYFELELQYRREYHVNALRLNTGRNAFEYILKAKKYTKVYLPYYTCDVMLQPIQKLGISYEFYHINELFEPVFNYEIIEPDAAFVYTNYFGLKDRFIQQLDCKNLIIDNSQAFYSEKLPGVDTFYSPRKFFGLPDGGYLYTDTFLKENFEKDLSYSRFEHLLKRIDKSPEEGYSKFSENDKALNNLPIKIMSSLTERLLKSIDYTEIAQKRIENFNFLKAALDPLNKARFELQGQVPMVYPLFTIKDGLREELIKNRIYVASYWPNVLQWTTPTSIEYQLTTGIIPLPIDQRYNVKAMERIINIISKYYEY